MATGQCKETEAVAGCGQPAISTSKPNLDKIEDNFVVAVKKSEYAIKTAIQDLKREFMQTFFGGNNGGVAGGMI